MRQLHLGQPKLFLRLLLGSTQLLKHHNRKGGAVRSSATSSHLWLTKHNRGGEKNEKRKNSKEKKNNKTKTKRIFPPAIEPCGAWAPPRRHLRPRARRGLGEAGAAGAAGAGRPRPGRGGGTCRAFFFGVLRFLPPPPRHFFVFFWVGVLWKGI